MVKGIGSVVAVAVSIACAFLLSSQVDAQELRDPLIEPRSGGIGSRFQVVGQRGWTPGETVTLQFLFTTGEPLRTAGPFAVQHHVTVLADGTWSFPVSVNDMFLGMPLGSEPGFIVVRAESASHTAQSAFVFTVDGRRPAGADTIAPLGFGPAGAARGSAIGALLFAAGSGTLLIVSGASRRAHEQSGLDFQAQLAQECIAVRFPAEEVTHELVTIDGPTAFEDLAPILRPRVAVEDTGSLETREHVVSKDA